jgi:hypothetical protein
LFAFKIHAWRRSISMYQYPAANKLSSHSWAVLTVAGLLLWYKGDSSSSHPIYFCRFNFPIAIGLIKFKMYQYCEFSWSSVLESEPLGNFLMDHIQYVYNPCLAFMMHHKIFSLGVLIINSFVCFCVIILF